jgi:UDP-N-acetyl-D-galactosamine dehydrogenase
MLPQAIAGKTVCVVGLGYVGYPLAEAFSHHLRTIGYDVDMSKIRSLNQTPENAILATSDPALIGEADFILICVPTPVTIFKDPDMSYVISAAVMVGKHLKKGATVVLESTRGRSSNENPGSPAGQIFS